MTHYNALKKIVEDHGLFFFGITDLNIESDFIRFKSWLAEGKHGEMNYLENYQDVRQNPQNILHGANSVISFGLAYFLGKPAEKNPLVAQYARIRDYHKTMKDSGLKVFNEVKNLLGTASDRGRITIDSAPVLERAIAAKTARGFIGKNTLFIHPEKGSFYLLGEIFSTLKLQADSPIKIDLKKRDPEIGGCGSCSRCQSHCPTGALDEAYKIDARRCLSYWTIEHRGTIPTEFWPHLKKYYFGCDICQLVCPYNRGIAAATHKEWCYPDLFDTAVMDQAFYVAHFAGTPMTRAKIDGLKRNALIALIVTKDHRISQALEYARSSDFMVVRETANQVPIFLREQN